MSQQSSPVALHPRPPGTRSGCCSGPMLKCHRELESNIAVSHDGLTERRREIMVASLVHHLLWRGSRAAGSIFIVQCNAERRAGRMRGVRDKQGWPTIHIRDAFHLSQVRTTGLTCFGCMDSSPKHESNHAARWIEDRSITGCACTWAIASQLYVPRLLCA
jgi:hypothetical protein